MNYFWGSATSLSEDEIERKVKEVPGSMGLPVVGEMVSFVKDPLDFVKVRSEKHGPIFKSRIMNVPTVFVTSHSAACQILNEDLSVAEGYNAFMGELFGKNILLCDRGTEYEKVRDIVKGSTDDLANQLYFNFMQEIVDKYISEIKCDGSAIETYELFKNICAHIMRLHVFNEKHDSEDVNNHIHTHFQALCSIPMPLEVKGFKSGYSKGIAAKEHIAGHLDESIDRIQTRMESKELDDIPCVCPFSSKAKLSSYADLGGLDSVLEEIRMEKNDNEKCSDFHSEASFSDLSMFAAHKKSENCSDVSQNSTISNVLAECLCNSNLGSGSLDDSEDGQADAIRQHLVLLSSSLVPKTLAALLVNCLWELNINKEVLIKCQQEQAKIQKTETKGELTYDDVMSMEYLQNVVKETERLRPPLLGCCRTATKDSEIRLREDISASDKKSKKSKNQRNPKTVREYIYKVPAGYRVWFSSLTANVDEKVYSEPLRFLPERWLDERTREPLTYGPPRMPNDNGSSQCPHSQSGDDKSHDHHHRQCLGKSFTRMLVKIVLSKLIRNFNFSLEDNQDLGLRYLPVVRPNSGLMVNFSQL